MKEIDVSTLEKLAAYLQERRLVLKTGYGHDRIVLRAFGDNDTDGPSWWARLSDGAVVFAHATGATLLQAIERAIAAYEVK